MMVASRRPVPPGRPATLGMALVLLAVGAITRADDGPTGCAQDARQTGWIELSDSLGTESWRQPTGAWAIVGDAAIHPENPRLLVGTPGEGVLLNGANGRTTNLVSAEEFGDVEFRCEFLVPTGSNSGIKFHGLYEVQILDSYGKETLTASDCGGIYPRAELFPRYHHIDAGHAPRANACRPPGCWQTLDITFRAPRFNARGQKVANARIVQVVLNGQLVQEDVELATPTGHNWTRPERAQGPLLLQADHGPVAFRNVRVRPIGAAVE